MFINWTLLKLKISVITKNHEEQKGNLQNGRIYLQDIYVISYILIKRLVPIMQRFSKSIRKTGQSNGKMSKTRNRQFTKELCKWPIIIIVINTGKSAELQSYQRNTN